MFLRDTTPVAVRQVEREREMDGWGGVGKWMDERVDGWVRGGPMDEWMSGGMSGWRVDEWTDGWTNGWLDG